jgi:hypothetical protein
MASDAYQKSLEDTARWIVRMRLTPAKLRRHIKVFTRCKELGIHTEETRAVNAGGLEALERALAAAEGRLVPKGGKTDAT